MFTLSAEPSADVCVDGSVSLCWQPAHLLTVCAAVRVCPAFRGARAGHVLRCPLLCCRVVGGFDTLTAMENVESDPKTDRPKVCASEQRALPLGLELGAWRAGGGPAHAPLPHQEEIRIDSTIVFVDPYEEADAQVRRGLGGRLCPRPARFCPWSPAWASARARLHPAPTDR